MANQMASGYGGSQQNPFDQTVGTQVNQGGAALPNMDPYKATSYLSGMGRTANARTGTAMAQGGVNPGAPPPNPNVARPGYMPTGPLNPGWTAPGYGRTGGPSAATYTGTTSGGQTQTGQPVDQMQQFGGQLLNQAQGNQNPQQTEANLHAAAAARAQAQQSAQQQLARSGFAPASALGLSYSRAIDQQVAQLMNTRQAQQQQQAEQNYTSFLGEQQAAQQFGQTFGLTQQEMQQKVQEFAQQQQLEQQKLKQGGQQNIMSFLGGKGPGNLLTGLGSAAGAIGSAGGSIMDWLGSMVANPADLALIAG